MKTALITGITGQDGSYLTELLIKKDTGFTVSFVGPVPSIQNVLNICTKIRMIEGAK